MFPPGFDTDSSPLCLPTLRSDPISLAVRQEEALNPLQTQWRAHYSRAPLPIWPRLPVQVAVAILQWGFCFTQTQTISSILSTDVLGLHHLNTRCFGFINVTSVSIGTM